MRKSGGRASKGTAAEFLRGLENDPQYLAHVQEKAKQVDELRRRHQEAISPVLTELREEGIAVDSLDDLPKSGIYYDRAIPILVKWLRSVDDVSVKESIVRVLSVPSAKPRALAALVEEFRSANGNDISSLKWTIGNALEIIADDSVFTQLVELVQDRRHGVAREMLAVALGNMADPRAVDVLINLLGDDEIAGHAVIGLGKLESQKARPYIEPFLGHQASWIRKEAKRALAKLKQ